jgi:hypothetical protein
MLMAETTDNEFYLPFNFGEDKIEFSYVSYVDNADYKLYENIQGGGSVQLAETSNIQVYVRVRPPLQREIGSDGSY